MEVLANIHNSMCQYYVYHVKDGHRCHMHTNMSEHNAEQASSRSRIGQARALKGQLQEDRRLDAATGTCVVKQEDPQRIR